MIIQLAFNNKLYKADLQNGVDISLPIQEGAQNVNCYYAEPVVFQTIEMGSFVGSVQRGGSVNYQKLSITPHGNGTHTECYGHLEATSITINQCLKKFHFIAQLVTVIPDKQNNGDNIIKLESFKEKIKNENLPEAIIIRTLPNDDAKTTLHYSGTNPSYLEPALPKWLAEKNVKQLLLDLPSVDKEIDGGLLAAHRAFWNLPYQPRTDACITELVFVPNFIQDGLYLLNLQIISLEMDASPSKPILYPLDLL
ncbi:MAG: cyclase family protein [Flammeovirgaceae bacterium]|nr:cyclase family protein [Flammeovirgaceae bacterium]